MENTLKLILIQYKQGRSFEETKQSLSDLFSSEQQSTSQQQTIERLREVLKKKYQDCGAGPIEIAKEAEQLLNTTEP